MNSRLDPQLVDELKEYGAVGIEKCFNCGNCTAICPLASDEYPFPRNVIRRIQIGQRERLAQQLDPWLCYYCGDCSATCPKGAEPGETMMAARRWLTAQYDWTGLSQRLYKSNVWAFGSVIVAAVMIVLMAILLHGPVIVDHVELNTFAPVELIHIGDLILAALLGFFLLTNLYRMYRLVFHDGKNEKIPLSLFITESWNIILHLVTQKRFSQCEGKRSWVNHLILVSGYGAMFLLIVIFLPWFQTDNIYPIYHPQRWIGYLAAAALIYGAGYALWARIRKNDQQYRYSHLSDWLFPILLVLLALSGLVIHVFRYLALPLATYYAYVAHLAIMLSLYVCVGPMGKWSHLLYRPFAVYFQAVREKVQERREAPEALAPAD